MVGGRAAEEEKETDRGEGRQQGRHNLRRRTNRETRGETDGWGAGKVGRGAYKGSSWLQVAWWGIGALKQQQRRQRQRTDMDTKRVLRKRWASRIGRWTKERARMD